MCAIDRREFSTTLALAAAAGLARPAAVFAGTRQGRATYFDWQPINDAMQVAFGTGGNVLAVTDGGALLLVDTKNAGYGGVLRAEAESFGGTLESVITTHHHGDHVGGNPFFTPEVPVYGQERCVERATRTGSPTLAGIIRDPEGRLERYRRQIDNAEVSAEAKAAALASAEAFVGMNETLWAKDFAPTETLEEELEVGVGTIDVELRHVDFGHTDNDVFVYIPEADVLHAGDLFFNGLHPFIDVGAGATTVGWQNCLEAMIDVAGGDTVCIPGHGPISDRDGLRDFSDYFDILREFVQERIDDGLSRDEISQMVPPEFADWPPRRLDANLGVVYDELTAE